MYYLLGYVGESRIMMHVHIFLYLIVLPLQVRSKVHMEDRNQRLWDDAVYLNRHICIHIIIILSLDSHTYIQSFHILFICAKIGNRKRNKYLILNDYLVKISFLPFISS